MIEQVLEENSKVVRELPKIFGNSQYEKFYQILFEEDSVSMKELMPNISLLIESSDQFLLDRAVIKEIVQRDFHLSQGKIEQGFLQCRRIHQESKTFNALQWVEAEPDLDMIRQKVL